MTPARTAALLFLAVAALYLPSARNGFVYDDHEVILEQQPARTLRQVARLFAEPHGLPQSRLPYYRPTTRASLLLQKAWFGDGPASFHVANALLAGALAIAAWSLLRQRAFGFSAASAAWVAAAFAMHPIASECVYPAASGRETALPAFFMLVALSAWISGGRRGRALGTLSFALALWSKELALFVPVSMAWADALQLSPDAPRRRVRVWIARYAPLAAVAIAYLAVRSVVIPGWAAPARDRTLLFSALMANPWGPLQSLLYLVQSTLAPNAPLAYEPAFAVWFSPVRSALAVAGFGVIVATALWMRPAERPAPSRAASLFWLGFIPVAMALHLNLLPVEVPFAERYVLVSSLGVIALAATAGRRIAARLARPRGATWIGVATLVALAVLTLHRAVYYHDEIAFTEQWVAASPQVGNAHASLGAALARAGRLDEAVPALREAVRLDPRLASAHYNLGAILAEQGRSDEAIAEFRETLRWWSGDPDAHYALGVLLAQRSELDAAELQLREAARLRPGWSEPIAVLRRIEASRPTP